MPKASSMHTLQWAKSNPLRVMFIGHEIVPVENTRPCLDGWTSGP